MPVSMKNQAAVAGIGATAITRNSGVSELALACEAISKCLDDAGVAPGDVDGLVTYTLESNDEVEVARAVGLGELTMYAKINYGGGAAVGLVQQAAMAITSGAAKNVVIWRAMNGRSGQRMGQGVSGHIISTDLIHWSWYMAYGMLTPASWVSLIANKYMNLYGVTAEHLAEVAITQRNFALNNPNALNYGKPADAGGVPERQADHRIAAHPRLLPGNRLRRGAAGDQYRARARPAAQAGRDPGRDAGLDPGPGADDQLLPG